MNNKKIVICGSMKFKEEMKKAQKILQDNGFDVLIPEDPKNIINSTMKREYSMLHFNKIADSHTDAILVLNFDKNDKKNYIGPNSFAEIALAFFLNKRIYLLNDLYEPYKDELLAWEVITLNGDIKNIKD